MPSSELNDYIQLQKEIKRLADDNAHLMSENRELMNKLKSKKGRKPSAEETQKLSDDFSQKQRNYEEAIESLKNDIYVTINE